MDRRGRVLTLQQRAVQVRGDGRSHQRQIGAHVRLGAHPQPQELPVGAQRQIGPGDVVAAVRVGHEALAAGCRPLHRPADLPGAPGDDRLFRVVEDLAAETAADVRPDHAQLVLGKPQHAAHDRADRVRVLGRGVQRGSLRRRVIVGQRGPWLDGVGDEPLIAELQGGDVGRARARRVGGLAVAQVPDEGEVVLRFRVDLRRPFGDRLRHLGHRRQFAVAHLDQLGGVLRLFHGLCDHAGDAVADVAHRAGRQHRVRRLVHGLAGVEVDRPRARQAAEPVSLDVRAREHRDDAGRGGCGGDVDALNLGM